MLWIQRQRSKYPVVALKCPISLALDYCRLCLQALKPLQARQWTFSISLLGFMGQLPLSIWWHGLVLCYSARHDALENMAQHEALVVYANVPRPCTESPNLPKYMMPQVSNDKVVYIYS